MWNPHAPHPQPLYFYELKGLSLAFKPALPGWLFTKEETTLKYLDQKGVWKSYLLPKNTYAFNFMGATLVVYHNPSRKNTFDGLAIKNISLKYLGNKKNVEIKDSVIPSSQAQDIRDGKVERIDVWFNK